MLPTEVNVKFFRDREALYDFGLIDGTTMRAKVLEVNSSFDGNILSFKLLTTEGDTLTTLINAVLSIDLVIEDDPDAYRFFLANHDDPMNIWTFELLNREAIPCRVQSVGKLVDGSIQTILLTTLDGERFEIPWTAIAKIRY